LGRDGPRVSAIGMGCFAFGGDRKTGTHLSKEMEKLHEGVWGDQKDEDTYATVKAALDAGINFFDTAEMYGDGYSEEVLGRALKKSGYSRDSYLVATKVCENYLTPELLSQHLEASLARLQLDYVDLFQVHWHSRAAVRTPAYPERPLEKEIPLKDTMLALSALKASGKIRHIGVCNFGVKDIREVVSIGVPIVSNQVPYGLLWRGIEHELQSLCAEHGIAMMPWGPLFQGILCGKFKTADDVPPGRARTRLFSNKRPQQRHGEAGLEAETFAAVEAIRKIAEGAGRPMTDTSIAWVLQQANIGTCLMGARNAAQLKSNLAALKTKLDEHTLGQLDAATRDVKQKLGTNIDPYETSANSRIV